MVSEGWMSKMLTTTMLTYYWIPTWIHRSEVDELGKIVYVIWREDFSIIFTSIILLVQLYCCCWRILSEDGKFLSNWHYINLRQIKVGREMGCDDDVSGAFMVEMLRYSWRCYRYWSSQNWTQILQLKIRKLQSNCQLLLYHLLKSIRIKIWSKINVTEISLSIHLTK